MIYRSRTRLQREVIAGVGFPEYSQRCAATSTVWQRIECAWAVDHKPNVRVPFRFCLSPCDQHAAGAPHNFIHSLFFFFLFLFVRTISFGEAYLAQLDRMGTTWWWLDDNPYWTARMLYEHSAKLRGDKHGIAFSRWGEYFFF